MKACRMLNVFKYIDNPEELSLYNEIGNKLDLMSQTINWGKTIDEIDLKPISHIIMKNANLAVHYAQKIIKGRWLEAEKYIKKDPSSAVYYAINIIGGRFKEAEPYIMKEIMPVCHYITGILSKDPDYPNGRWPEAESVIKKDADIWSRYKELVGIE
jgi:hypothetical protein